MDKIGHRTSIFAHTCMSLGLCRSTHGATKARFSRGSRATLCTLARMANLGREAWPGATRASQAVSSCQAQTPFELRLLRNQRLLHSQELSQSLLCSSSSSLTSQSFSHSSKFFLALAYMPCEHLLNDFLMASQTQKAKTEILIFVTEIVDYGSKGDLRP